MRRTAPRPLGAALERVASAAAPATTLASVQRHWADVAGEHVAAEAAPVRERDGEVTIACRSSVWAAELGYLAGDLADRLNDALERSEGGRPVRRLRFQTRSSEGLP